MSLLPVPLPWKWNEHKSNFSGVILVYPPSGNQPATAAGECCRANVGQADSTTITLVEQSCSCCGPPRPEEAEGTTSRCISAISSSTSSSEGTEGQRPVITSCKRLRYQGASKLSWRAGRSSVPSGPESGCRQNLPEAIPFSPLLPRLWREMSEGLGAQS